MKQKNRGDKRKEKYGSALSGPSYANKQKVDIKDIDELTNKNSRAKNKSRGQVTTSSLSTTRTTRVLGYLNDRDRFNEAINSKTAHVPIIIDFTQNNAACKRMRGAFDSLSMDNQQMQFYLVDVEEGDTVAQKYEIDVMPTFVIFENGAEVDRMSGTNEQVLKDFVAKHT